LKYWAFLSYSHTDKQWGDWLHKALETYRVPGRLIGRESRDGTVPPRVFPIFRDREELPVSADLGSNINEALRESRYLIVICSPRSAQSRWVGEEIKTYKKLGREDRILALIVEGEPNASDGKAGIPAKEECFPEALRYRMVEGEFSQLRSEPIAADAREGKDGRNNAKLKLLAGLLGVNYDDLKQRDNERRLRRLRITVALSLALVSGFAAVSVYALRQKHFAEQQQVRAESEQKKAESALAETRATLSKSDFLQAIRAIDEGRIPDALAQLARSLSLNPRNEASLCRLMTLLSYRNFGVPLALLKQDGPIHTAQLPPDATVSQQSKSILGEQADTWNAEKQVVKVHPMYQNDPDSIRSVDLSPDEERVLIFSDYHIARIWDARTGQAIAEPFKYGERGEGGGVYLSPDGKRAVNVGGPVRLWDPKTAKPVADPLLESEDGDWAGFSSDSKLLAAASGQGLWLWDAQTGKLLQGPLQPETRIRFAKFSPDGKRIATASDQSILLWDTQTGTQVGAPLDNESEVLSIQFSADGRHIATISRDNSARVWDLESSKPLTPPLKQAGESSSPAQFSSDGTHLVVPSGNIATVWDASNGNRLAGPLSHAAGVTSARFSQDSRRIVTASADKTVRIWDSVSGSPLLEALMHPEEVRWANFSTDGQRLLTLLSDTTGRIWDVRRGAGLPTRLKHDGAVVSTEFTQDGSGIMTISQNTGTGTSAQVWDAITGRLRVNPKSCVTTDTVPEFSRDGTRLLTKSEKSAQVWDVKSGKPIGQRLTHEDFLMSVHFSPDGTRVVTASQDKTARIWNAENGTPVGEPFLHPDKLLWAQFSPDGRRIATSSDDKTLRVWDASTGTQVTKWDYVTYIGSAEFSPDGQRLVTWTLDDNSARIWDIPSVQPLGALHHSGQVASAHFSPDGTRIVTASDDRTARVWDARTGKPLTDPLRHARAVTSALFGQGGRQIVTLSDNNTVTLWDAETGKSLAEPFNQCGEVLSAQFSPDNTRLVISSTKGYVFLWDLGPADKVAPAWLLKLSEALAERHLDDQSVFQPLIPDSSQMIQEISKQISQAPPEDKWAAWGRWWLADRGSRTISPSSPVTVPQYLEDRIKENMSASLDEAEQLAVGQPEVYERIRRAREALKKESSQNTPRP
jgi:WD40 repeat protein